MKNPVFAAKTSPATTKNVTCAPVAFVPALLPVDTPPPDRLPNPWPIDSERLLGELDRVREIVVRIPLHMETRTAQQVAIDALWRLRDDLRETLRIQREMQTSFANKHQKVSASPSSQTKKTQKISKRNVI